jgi:3-phosphoshikimate 1-carboxyvinyltransferase
VRVDPAPRLRGELRPPTDKSISHRAAILGAMAAEPVRIRGYLDAADTRSTLAAVQRLGALVEAGPDEIVVRGTGLRRAIAPDTPIDVGNAGTLMRLLPGWLAAQEGRAFVLDGDESIRRRPVDRVAMPLRLMGAVLGDSDGRPPLHIDGGGELQPIGYELPVASAQVKSCILLAGLYAVTGPTTVIEPVPTRDHTERLLRAAGARIARGPRTVSVWPVERLQLDSVAVPGDISSAAPFLIAATLLAESRLFVRGMSTNPTRTGMLTVLERMGARINLFNRRTTAGGEPIADVEVHSAELVATEVEPEIVPSLIDELPLLALAACMARGRTIVRGASELRVKESNRLETVAELLRAIGGHVQATADGWEIQGVPARPDGGRVDAHGDHRIGMLGAIAGLVSRGGVRVEGASAIGVSYPGFARELERLAVRPW